MSNIKGRFRWGVISLIALATVINYIDRNALAVMWPEVSKEIGATKEDYALLVTIFMIFYAFGQSLFGRIFDAIGTRMGFTLRSEERRVGKEGVRTCRSRWSTTH